MKKKSGNKTSKNLSRQTKSVGGLFIWIVTAFILGAVIGFTTYYLADNWNGFFAKCPDGTRPDKNGCCPGEVYTDAGDGWMVCCPDGANDCFPPMK